MSISKKIVGGVAALALVSGGASVALAATPSLCPSSKVCLFDRADYTSLMGYRSGGYGLANISPTNNDRMSSWANKSSSHGAWYMHANGQGSCQNMNAGARVAYVGFWFNDEASSWRTNGPC